MGDAPFHFLGVNIERLAGDGADLLWREPFERMGGGGGLGAENRCHGVPEGQVTGSPCDGASSGNTGTPLHHPSHVVVPALSCLLAVGGCK